VDSQRSSDDHLDMVDCPGPRALLRLASVVVGREATGLEQLGPVPGRTLDAEESPDGKQNHPGLTQDGVGGEDPQGQTEEQNQQRNEGD